MQLICEAPNLAEYLTELPDLNYSHPLIQQQLHHLQGSQSELEQARKIYEFVRDEIHHSCDFPSQQVTCIASDVLQHREGLCFAKSHLLAALLRAQGIPTGLCYQRLLAGERPEEGYVIHGLVAIYLPSINRWIRLDARGNRPGIHAEFSLDEVKLAYPINPKLGEIDYPIIYAQPHPKVLHLLKTYTNSLEECLEHIPGEL